MRIVYLMTTNDNDSNDSADDDAVEHNIGMTLLGTPNWAKEQSTSSIQNQYYF